MKRSSRIILVIIFLIFAVIQGWVLYAKFGPASFQTEQATLMGDTMMVGTPVSGIVRSVNVTEGQRVEKGQPLFMIFQQSPLDPDGGVPITIVAQHAGTVYGISAIPDSFVQASQLLARIVDTSPAGLYVQATLTVSPEEFSLVTTGQHATVQASFLNNNKSIAAVVTTVGLYDAVRRTVDVRLRMLTPPTNPDMDTIIGLPVNVSMDAGVVTKAAAKKQ